jgi:hypothetical protein
VLEEITFPARSLACVLAMAGFFLLMTLASSAGLLGLWLAAIVLPALFRYLIITAEARAAGHDVDPPGIEFFSLASNGWSLFPVLPVLFFAWLIYSAAQVSSALAIGVGLLALAVFPAMMAVLVITHSPMQSLNPVALLRLVNAVGPAYLYAPLLAVSVIWIPYALGSIPGLLQSAIELYLAFAFYSVTGALLREKNLVADIDIPLSDDVAAGQDEARLNRERMATLNHAYALAGRGNRAGALAHIEKWLADDPYPDAARDWFMKNLLAWEQPDFALFFAQHHLRWLLDEGDALRAVKLILRCRLENAAFRPLDDDLPQAIAAAYRCNNSELAEELEIHRQ